MIIHASLLAVVLAAKSSSKTSSSASSVIYILILVALFYFLWRGFSRPRQQQAARQRDLMSNLTVGDEVLTGAGIFGTVLDIENDRVTLETAPGTRLTVLRSTINRRIGAESIGPESDLAARADVDHVDDHGEHDLEDVDHHDDHGDDDHDDEDDDGHDDAEAATASGVGHVDDADDDSTVHRVSGLGAEASNGHPLAGGAGEDQGTSGQAEAW